MVTTRYSISSTSMSWYKHLLKMYVYLTWSSPSEARPLYAPAEHMSGYFP